MNVLGFERLAVTPVPHGNFDAPTDVAAPVVDGVRLADRVGGALDPGVGVDAVAGSAWRGRPSDEKGGRAVLLDGSCGIPDCCGVMARITVTGDPVRWADLFTRAGDADLAGLAFTCDRAPYEAALAVLPTLVATPWSWPPEDDES